jgi:hypothetical protein
MVALNTNLSMTTSSQENIPVMLSSNQPVLGRLYIRSDNGKNFGSTDSYCQAQVFMQ